MSTLPDQDPFNTEDPAVGPVELVPAEAAIEIANSHAPESRDNQEFAEEIGLFPGNDLIRVGDATEVGQALRLAEHPSGDHLLDHYSPAPFHPAEFPSSHSPDERLPFQSWHEPQIPTLPRIPNFGHVGILGVLAIFGLLGAALLSKAALYFHLWGISSVAKASTDIHYTLGYMAAVYCITFGAAVLLFPLFWHEPFFAGVQWNGSTALRRLPTLFGAAGICFVLAIVDEIALPGPTNAPIDQLFNTRAAAWLLFAFGVTVAPIFEEMIFRGFLLPALCTAVDWATELTTGRHPLPLGPNNHPRWSLPAMVIGSIITSIPFAAMHAEQTGYSLGPFVLLVGVSLVLCWVRLRNRSLACSVVVHASYNFLLFSVMLIGTHGFKHLDKM